MPAHLLRRLGAAESQCRHPQGPSTVVSHIFGDFVQHRLDVVAQFAHGRGHEAAQAPAARAVWKPWWPSSVVGRTGCVKKAKPEGLQRAKLAIRFDRRRRSASGDSCLRQPHVPPLKNRHRPLTSRNSLFRSGSGMAGRRGPSGALMIATRHGGVSGMLQALSHGAATSAGLITHRYACCGQLRLPLIARCGALPSFSKRGSVWMAVQCHFHQEREHAQRHLVCHFGRAHHSGGGLRRVYRVTGRSGVGIGSAHGRFVVALAFSSTGGLGRPGLDLGSVAWGGQCHALGVCVRGVNAMHEVRVGGPMRCILAPFRWGSLLMVAPLGSGHRFPGCPVMDDHRCNPCVFMRIFARARALSGRIRAEFWLPPPQTLGFCLRPHLVDLMTNRLAPSAYPSDAYASLADRQRGTPRTARAWRGRRAASTLSSERTCR